jgi:outer membrane murein-binding lipoprotein Lpp
VAKFTARAKNAKKTDDKLDNIANAIEDLAAFVDDLEQQLSQFALGAVHSVVASTL